MLQCSAKSCWCVHRDIPCAHISLLLKIIRSHLSQSSRTHCSLEMVVAYLKKAEQNHLGEKIIVSDLTSSQSKEFDDHCFNIPNQYRWLLFSLCCAVRKILWKLWLPVEFTIYLILKWWPQKYSPVPCSLVPSCLPIHSLSMKPQCIEKNDIPGRQKLLCPSLEPSAPWLDQSPFWRTIAKSKSKS